MTAGKFAAALLLVSGVTLGMATPPHLQTPSFSPRMADPWRSRGTLHSLVSRVLARGVAAAAAVAGAAVRVVRLSASFTFIASVRRVGRKQDSSRRLRLLLATALAFHSRQKGIRFSLDRFAPLPSHNRVAVAVVAVHPQNLQRPRRLIRQLVPCTCSSVAPT